MNIIEIKNLSFSYSESLHALSNVNLDIKRGEWISILGHNGSGKSTLSKLIIGLLKADEGEILVDGLVLNEDNVHDIRRKIGIVFQNPDNQFVGVTVEDDIAFGMENLCFPQEEIISKITEYAEKVNMLDYLKKEPQALSGGQKQRVAIAGILAMKTDIIIFDEATSMLDPKGRASIMEYIKEINKAGVTVITITHDMKEAVLSDRIVILKDGRVIACGETVDVLNNRDILKSSNLELLLPLQLLHLLEENNVVDDSVKDILWQLSLNK